MSKIILLFLSIILVSSCNKAKPIGMWDDIINLSSKNIKFGIKTDSVLIKTGGNRWWIDGITLDDSTFSYYNNENINLESDSYTIIENNFIVERREKYTIFIKLDENITRKERIMTIDLEAGDYFDSIIIKQSASN